MVDVDALREAAADIRASGCSDGLAGHMQTIAYALPGSTTEHVVYDLALAVGLWCSDVADLIEAVATETETTSGPGRSAAGEQP